MKDRSVALPDEQWAALTELAKAEDRTVSAVIRRAIVAYIDEHGIVNGLSGTTRKSLRRMHMAWGGDGNIAPTRDPNAEEARLIREQFPNLKEPKVVK